MLRKAWKRWCAEHTGELPLPVKSIRQHKGSTVLRFAGAHPCLHFSLGAHSLYTVILVNGKDSGFPFCLDLSAVQDETGHWYCRQCEADSRDHFATLYDLAEDHYFKPWTAHVRALLRPDTWILLHESEGWSGCDIVTQSRAIESMKQGASSAAFRTVPDAQMFDAGQALEQRSSQRVIATGRLFSI